MLLLLTVTLQITPTLGGFDLATSIKRPPTATTPNCDSESTGGDIVVCGRTQDRFRLPLPTAPDPDAGRVDGNAQSGLTAITPAKPCGIFAADRYCGKRESARYGYGMGRDPVTILTRLTRKAVDPDAD